jgi:hypothetical protein
MQRRNVDKFHAILPLPRVVHPASTAPMRRIFFSKTQFASAIYPLRRRAYGPASAFSRVRQVLRDPHPIRIRTHQSRVGRSTPSEPLASRRRFGRASKGRRNYSCSRAKLRVGSGRCRNPFPPLPAVPCVTPSGRAPSSRASQMASRDKVGCPPAALPLDRVLAALAANVGQLGRRWEAAVHGRFEKADAVRGVAEGKSHAIEMHTPLFYVTCALGGVLSTGLTHLAVTPLDLVKCNMQVRGHVRQPEASACFTSRLNGG